MAPPSEMHVDPTELKAQAGKLDTEGTDLNTKLTNALTGLAMLGYFWGDDKYGTDFHDGVNGKPGYGAQVDNAQKDVSAITNGYHTIANGFLQMAKNIDVANWNSIVSLPKVPE